MRNLSYAGKPPSRLYKQGGNGAIISVRECSSPEGNLNRFFKADDFCDEWFAEGRRLFWFLE